MCTIGCFTQIQKCQDEIGPYPSPLMETHQCVILSLHSLGVLPFCPSFQGAQWNSPWQGWGMPFLQVVKTAHRLPSPPMEMTELGKWGRVKLSLQTPLFWNGLHEETNWSSHQSVTWNDHELTSRGSSFWPLPWFPFRWLWKSHVGQRESIK